MSSESVLEDTLFSILETHGRLRRDLELVESLELPEWCIAAGYVRNFVWDFLHGYERKTQLNDVDVLYFDRSDLTEAPEKNYEQRLKRSVPEYHWSVKNQARMHLRNGHEPYESVEDAMRRWPETATAVGIALGPSGEWKVIAPYGLSDLLGMRVRRSPLFADRSYFEARIRQKNWFALWPQLEMENEVNP
jgi:hypothetical protein